MSKAAMRSRHTERQALPLSMDEKMFSSVEVRAVSVEQPSRLYMYMPPYQVKSSQKSFNRSRDGNSADTEATEFVT